MQYMDNSVTDIDEIVRTVLTTRKYRSVYPDTVRQIAGRELARHGDLKKALKGTKSRLHQFYGAFEREIDYEAAISHLDAAFKTGFSPAIEETCRKILLMHQSTAERLPILDEFYTAIWTLTGVPYSLLDLACGLNPLTLPWMHLSGGAQYFAFDIDVRRIAFLNRFFLLAGFPPLATWQDIVCHPPQMNADIALLLKTSPTLERQEKGSTRRLLQSLKTPFIVVSFSVRSLGGREKGMPAHYEREFLAMVKDEPWRVSKLTFETELAFVIGK